MLPHFQKIRENRKKPDYIYQLLFGNITESHQESQAAYAVNAVSIRYLFF